MNKQGSKNTDKAAASYLTYKFRAYPTTLQEYKLENWLSILCWFYNYEINEYRRIWDEEHRTPTKFERQRNLTAFKREEPALRLVYSGVLKAIIDKIDWAYKRFFVAIRNKEGHISPPKPKKPDQYLSLTYPQVWMTHKNYPDGYPVIKFEKLNDKFAYIHLPKLGGLKIRLHRPIDWTKAKNVTIKRHPSGRWYVYVTVEVPNNNDATIVIDTNNKQRIIGIDLGLTNLIVSSDGNIVSNPRFITKLEKRIKRVQKQLSRKQRGSANYMKQRRKLARLHERLANMRRGFLHHISHQLATNYDIIIFEDIKIRDLVSKRRRLHLSKYIYDAGWNTLINLTSYKARLHGSQVIKVNPAYTTQTCSSCGHKVPKSLHDRIHKCPFCGATLDRDYNASINILKRGLHNIKEIQNEHTR